VLHRKLTAKYGYLEGHPLALDPLDEEDIKLQLAQRGVLSQAVRIEHFNAKILRISGLMASLNKFK
jgi:hypothetical protein